MINKIDLSLVIFFIATLAQQLSADKIYGPVIGSLSTNQHEVRGKVHALNLNTIGLRNFSYDGLGQEVFFWVGDDAAGPSATGRQVPDERGSISPLKTYRDATLVLILPDGSTLKTIKWFAIWDTKTATNYGSVTVPGDLVIPKEVAIGTMTGRTHGVSSGPVTVLDSRTIFIQNFSYDGTGPDAFFYVGTGAPSDKGILIPNEIGSVEKLPAYNKKNITLFLPEGINVYNIDYLSVWCRQFSVNFGEIIIPRDNITAPPFVAREVFIPFPPGRDELPLAKGDNVTSPAKPMAEGAAAKKGDAKSAAADEIDRHVTATNAMPLATSEPMTTAALPASSDDSAKKMAANDSSSSAVAKDAAVATTTPAVANDAHPAAVVDESKNANATESMSAASTQPASAATAIPTPPSSPAAATTAAGAASDSTSTTHAAPSSAKAADEAGSARAGIARVPSPSIADLAASVASGKRRSSTTLSPSAASKQTSSSPSGGVDSYTRTTTTTTTTTVVLQNDAAGNATTPATKSA